MAKKITIDLIRTLNPCKNRLQNAINFYSDKELTIKQFLSLKEISHNDKLWVAFRLMPEKNIRFAAGDIAKSVLKLYEDKYPEDNRPRNAIKEATKKKINKVALDNAHSAAYSAAWAKYSAADSAASAHSAALAAYSAADSAARSADSAALAAYSAARANEENKQLKIILKYWKKV